MKKIIFILTILAILLLLIYLLIPTNTEPKNKKGVELVENTNIIFVIDWQKH